MKYILTIIVVLSLLLTGCTQQDPLSGYCGENEQAVVMCEQVEATVEEVPVDIIIGDNNTIIIIDEETKIEEEPIKEEIIEEIVIIPEDIKYDIEKEFDEGALVSFADLEVKDPDGDLIELTFSSPLNENGEWQTTNEDQGEYPIVITATDGKSKTKLYALITITKENLAPTITAESEISVLEGETIVIESTVIDPELDEVTIMYSGWMSSSTYTTTYEDAGTYTVTITANDGNHEISKEISIIIIDVNRAPVIQIPDYDVVALEGELVELEIIANDADEDIITLSYEEPFLADGTWQTSKGEAGNYDITVTATDGIDTISIEVPISVISINNAPTLEEIASIEVNEGENVVIQVVASDSDEDELVIEFSGWMTSANYTTTYDDAGTHTVTVTVSDGTESVSQDVTVTVNDLNRPPEFIWG